MTGIRRGVKITSLFLLLAAVVLLPAVLLEQRGASLFSTVTLYPVETVELGGGEAAAQEYSLWERIKLLPQAHVIIQSAKYADLLTPGLVGKMEEQLTALQELNALPPLSFRDSVWSMCFYELRMLEPSDNEPAVRLWVIMAEYDDFFVCVYMDAETSVLYDVNITCKQQLYEVYDSSLSPQGFLEYIHYIAAAVGDAEDPEEKFVPSGYYGSSKIYLHLASFNRQTGEYTNYRLNDEIADGVTYAFKR